VVLTSALTADTTSPLVLYFANSQICTLYLISNPRVGYAVGRYTNFNNTSIDLLLLVINNF